MNKKIAIVMMTSFSGANYKAPQMVPIVRYLQGKNLLGKSFGIWDKQDESTYEKVILRKLKRSKLIKILFKAVSVFCRKAKKINPYLMREKIFGICALLLFRTDAEIVAVKPRPSFLIKKLKKQDKIIVVEASENHPRYTEEMLREECRKQNVPVVRNNYTNEKAIRDYEKAIAMADYLICLSKFSAQTYIQRGFPQNRISITGLETGTEFMMPRPVCDQEITFVCVANHGMLKGTHRLIKIWKEKNIKNKLLIIGLIYDDMKPFLEEAAIVESVEITGRMTQKEISGIYQSRKCVGVLLSLSESYGRGVYECLCTSTPVLVTPTCTCDLVEDGRNGYILSSYDDELIYKRILDFINMDKEMYYKMAEHAYEAVRNHTDRFEEKYTDALLRAGTLGKYKNVTDS